MPLNPDETLTLFRDKLAAAGHGPADVRVELDPDSLGGNALNVTILRLGVRLAAIDAIVRAYLEPQFDARNELLLGWRRQVDVRYSREALAPLLAMARHRIRGIKPGQSTTLGRYVVSRTDAAISWEVDLTDDPRFIPRAFATERRAALYVAQMVAAQGEESIP